MGNFYALTIGGKNHRVIADNIAGTHAGKTNGVTITRTGLPFAPVHGTLGQITIQRFGDYFTHA